MADICIACDERLATVTPACGHRQYCVECFNRTQEESNGAQNCALCRQSVVPIVNSRAVQLQPVTLAKSLINYDVLEKEYPFGALLFEKEKNVATQDICQSVKEAMDAVQASKLSLTDLKKALRQRLTMEQYDMVFVELIKNEDLHAVLKQLDMRKFEKRSITTKVQQMVVRLVESPDMDAVAYRAVAATAVGSGFDLLLGGMAGFGAAGIGACAGSNLVVFLGFTAVEIYRWLKGQSGGKELAKSIGEHAVGAISGAAGAFCGFQLGALVGTAIFPVIGTAVGGIIGSIISGLCFDGAGRFIYRKLFPGQKTEVTEFEETQEFDQSPRELTEICAAKFGILVDLDTFEEAHNRFRRCLLASHPDKHPNASEEERLRLTAETADILACWNIVREYYRDHGDVENSDSGEGFVKAYVLKAFDTATQQWRVVRTFFDDVDLGFDTDPCKEVLETVMIYV